MACLERLSKKSDTLWRYSLNQIFSRANLEAYSKFAASGRQPPAVGAVLALKDEKITSPSTPEGGTVYVSV